MCSSEGAHRPLFVSLSTLCLCHVMDRDQALLRFTPFSLCWYFYTRLHKLSQQRRWERVRLVGTSSTACGETKSVKLICVSQRGRCHGDVSADAQAFLILNLRTGAGRIRAPVCYHVGVCVHMCLCGGWGRASLLWHWGQNCCLGHMSCQVWNGVLAYSHMSQVRRVSVGRSWKSNHTNTRTPSRTEHMDRDIEGTLQPGHGA